MNHQPELDVEQFQDFDHEEIVDRGEDFDRAKLLDGEIDESTPETHQTSVQPTRSTWQVIQHSPEFTKLWLATIVSNAGDWFTFPLLISIVYDFSQDTAFASIAISLYFLTRTVPPLIFSSLGGVLLDRFNRKHILVMCNVVRGILAPCFLYGQAIHSLPLIYLISFLQFTFSAFFEPGESALLPSLVEPEDAVTANTLVSVTWSVITAIGAVTGGLITSHFGAVSAFSIDSASFFVASLLIAWIKPAKNKIVPISFESKTELSSVPGAEFEDTLDIDLSSENITPEPATASVKSQVVTFMDGFKYAFQSPLILLAIFFKFCLACSNFMTVLSVVASKSDPFRDNGVLSQALMWSFFGAGSFTGSRLASCFTKGASISSVMRSSGIVSASGIGVSWLFVVLGTSIHAGSAIEFLTLAFFCMAMYFRAIYTCFVWINSQVMIQLIVPDDKLGRMFSFDWIGLNLGLIVNTLFQGALLDVLGENHLIATTFILSIAASIPTIVWLIASSAWQANNPTPHLRESH